MALLDLGEGAAAVEAARREQIEAARASSRATFAPLLDIVYKVVQPPLLPLQAKLNKVPLPVPLSAAVLPCLPMLPSLFPFSLYS